MKGLASAIVMRARSIRQEKGQVQIKDLGCHYFALIVSCVADAGNSMSSACVLCPAGSYATSSGLREYSSHFMMQHSGLSQEGEALQVRHSRRVEPASGRMQSDTYNDEPGRHELETICYKFIPCHDAGWQLARSG
jgi:hypothetical protein